jgi:hypothetical protein
MLKLTLALFAMISSLLPLSAAAQTPADTPTATVTPTASGTMPAEETGTPTPATTPATTTPTASATASAPAGSMRVTAHVVAPAGSQAVFDNLGPSGTIIVCHTETTTGPLVDGASLLVATLPPVCGQSVINCVVFSPELPGPCVRLTIDGEQYKLFGFQPGASVDLGVLRAIVIVADIAAPETGTAGVADTQPSVAPAVWLALAMAGVIIAKYGYGLRANRR